MPEIGMKVNAWGEILSNDGLPRNGILMMLLLYKIKKIMYNTLKNL